MMRKMEVMGRLGNDPEQKETKNGKPYLQFRIANNAFGDPENYTMWATVTVWEGSRCYGTAKSLKKGNQVIVEGDYFQRTYISKATNKMEIGNDIHATGIYFCGVSNKENNDQMADAPATDEAPVETPVEQPKSEKKTTSKGTKTTKAVEAPAETAEADDDLPF